ncbi:MAG: stealth conserved region 3 domain-containing protein [Candidatus Nanopelagicales bacterium]
MAITCRRVGRPSAAARQEGDEVSDNLQEFAPSDPLATLPAPGSTRTGRLLRRVTGGPGTPIFDAAVWARRSALQSRRWLRRTQQGAIPAAPQAGEQLRSLSRVRTRAVIDAQATPIDVHLRTAVWLRDLLDAHGIEYFAMPRNSLFLDLGIRAADAERFRDLIADEWDRRAIVYGPYTDRIYPAEAPRGGPAPGSFARERAVRLVLATGPQGVDWAWPLDAGVTVHFWVDMDGGVLGAPIRNRYATYLLQSTRASVAELDFHGETFRSLSDLVIPHVDDIDFPVDLVYTWVDGRDPVWRERMLHKREVVLGKVTANAIADARFQDLQELRYSLRSVHAFAPWVNRVWIVTDGQTPSWFDPSDDRVTIIDHRDIWDDPDKLPVFNSHAIEARLHHIPGLAEHYIYFNDDMMFARPVQATDFFAPGGLMKIFPSPHQVGLGGRTLHEGAAQTAAKNDREVLLAATGTVQTQRLKHASYPQRKSVALELEERFPEYYARTTGATFRSATDISCISLQSWYAFRTGRAASSSISFRYIDLMTEDDLREMEVLRKQRNAAIMCLNQSENSEVDPLMVQEKLHDFLDDYLPVPSPYEATP